MKAPYSTSNKKDMASVSPTKVATYAFQDFSMDTINTNLHLGFPDGVVPGILNNMGVDGIQLITNNPMKIECMTSFGVYVQDTLDADAQKHHGVEHHGVGLMANQAWAAEAPVAIVVVLLQRDERRNGCATIHIILAIMKMTPNHFGMFIVVKEA
eukprot:7752889-Ditylum_brightwellii.AAC.1